MDPWGLVIAAVKEMKSRGIVVSDACEIRFGQTYVVCVDEMTTGMYVVTRPSYDPDTITFYFLHVISLRFTLVLTTTTFPLSSHALLYFMTSCTSVSIGITYVLPAWLLLLPATT